MTDSLEINGLVLRLDYLIHKLVNFVNAPQTDEVIRLLLLYFKGWLKAGHCAECQLEKQIRQPLHQQALIEPCLQGWSVQFVRCTCRLHQAGG